MQDPNADPFEQLFTLVNADPSVLVACEEKAAKIERCGEEMINTISDLRAKGWRTHEPIWNACLFTNTAALDHTCLFTDLMRERSQWRRGLAIRSLATLIFEICDDLPAIFGKEFRRCARKLSVSGTSLNALNTALKTVNVFRNSHAAGLNDIRNIAGAHRDHDAIRMHDTVRKLNTMDFYQLSLKFGQLLQEVGPPAQAIMTETSYVRPLELGV